MTERRFRPDDAPFREGTHQKAPAPGRHNLHSAALRQARLAGETDLQTLASGQLPEGWDPRIAADPEILGEVVVAAAARLDYQDRNTKGDGFSGFETANPGAEHPEGHQREHWQEYESVMADVPEPPKVPQMAPVVVTAAAVPSAPRPAAEVAEHLSLAPQVTEPQRLAEATTSNGNRYDRPADQWPIMAESDTSAAVTERITAPAAPLARQRQQPTWDAPATALRLVPGGNNPRVGTSTASSATENDSPRIEVVYQNPGSASAIEPVTQEIRPPAPALAGLEDPTQPLSTISDPTGLLVTAEYQITTPHTQSNAS